MQKSLFMGIDIGTSGVRAVLFDKEGSQVSLAYKEYPMICNEPNMAELDPDLIFRSLIEVVQSCAQQADPVAYRIEAISFSTQLHSFMAVDEVGTPLTNVLTWADSRPLQQAQLIEQNFDAAALYQKTGCRVQHPMYPLSKILWLQATQPELYQQAHKFVTIKEYILHKLFGRYVIDITDASATACFNIHKFDWDEDILQNVLKVDKSKFGEPVECTYILNQIKPEYASRMGISADVPAVIGSGDGMLANVGCGVFDETSMSCTIGTSGALRIAVDKPLLDEQGRTWCYCFTKDTWVAGGAINNGGIVLKWLRDEHREQYEMEMAGLGLNNIYDLFNKYAAEIKPGSEGLIFLPHLTGERSPGWNASARGMIHGLGLIHGKKHLMRASMEGVMYELYSVYDIITQIDNNVEQIIANGGYVNSDIWLQIQADIFNKEIAVAQIGEAAAFGAAYVAMAAVGAIKDLRECLPIMQPTRKIKPNPENHAVYKESFKQYREFYDMLYKK